MFDLEKLKDLLAIAASEIEDEEELLSIKEMFTNIESTATGYAETKELLAKMEEDIAAKDELLEQRELELEESLNKIKELKVKKAKDFINNQVEEVEADEPEEKDISISYIG